jgi:acetolactate synthase small subunit
MQAFHICYRNTQGTLMRILNAVSRRAIDLPYVQAQAQPVGETHRVTLLLEVNAKQAGQLGRDWHAIVDVTEVESSAAQGILDHAATWTATPHPPEAAAGSSAEAAHAARA